LSHIKHAPSYKFTVLKDRFKWLEDSKRNLPGPGKYKSSDKSKKGRFVLSKYKSNVGFAFRDSRKAKVIYFFIKNLLIFKNRKN